MEPRQQQFVQFLPDPGGLPVAQSSPAGHAAAPKLRGQILPRDAGAQDEEDAFKTGAIVARLAAGMALSPRFDGNERFDQRPQFVIQQWLGHGCASLHHMAKSNPRAIVLGVLSDHTMLHICQPRLTYRHKFWTVMATAMTGTIQPSTSSE